MLARSRTAKVLTPDEVEAVTSPWKARGLIATLVAVAAAFGAWSLLLPVVPTAVLDEGGSERLAGASTGVFMLATVITQVFIPAVLRRLGYRVVIAVSSVLLGVPALFLAIGLDAPIVLAVSLVRGVGFGALSVAEAAIIAELVPKRLLGRTAGIFGVCVGAAQMVCLPLGLWLAEAAGYPPVFFLATLIGLLSLVACIFIPTIARHAVVDADLTTVRVPMWRLVAVPMLALMFVTTAYGAVATFLPVSVRELDAAAGAALAGVLLAVLNFAAMVGRYFAGVVLDRRGVPGTVMIPFQVTAAAGIAVIAAVLFTGASQWWLVLAAVLYGAGFGAVQNEALTQLFYRLPKSKVSEASAMWNIAFDSGPGLGSMAYGLVLVYVTLGQMYALATAVILIGVAVTLTDRSLGRNRVADVDNLRVRLRSVHAPGFRRRDGR
ncbi:MFS transporter [Corynebacterium sp.]|uniref:MFS transporter n=1 Tax=Corynebacterium sp. TaxID=1720 RepID=UPI002A90EC5B|nr:MFS transporter [Corynebacterium sp.]MDY5784998.1 MFS transporter [Corynebacterium sp.]